jgi:hypothetical protein
MADAWDNLDKFEAMCLEFRGEINSVHALLPQHAFARLTSPMICDLYDYDDFKAFTQWMHRSPYDFRDARARFLDAEESPFDELRAEFSSQESHGGYRLTKEASEGITIPKMKSLLIVKKKILDTSESLNEGIREDIGFDGYEWSESFHLTDKDTYDIIEKVKNPWFRDFASIDVFFDGIDDIWYAEAMVDIPVEKNAELSALLREAESITESLAGHAEDNFNGKLHAEVERIKRSRHA